MFAKKMETKIKNGLGGIVNILNFMLLIGNHKMEMNYSRL